MAEHEARVTGAPKVDESRSWRMPQEAGDAGVDDAMPALRGPETRMASFGVEADFLTKPVPRDDLARNVREILDR